jgi:hypothetical protein
LFFFLLLPAAAAYESLFFFLLPELKIYSQKAILKTESTNIK